MSVAAAYRIHVNQSTVDVLNSLKLGYKIQVRGLTELKVNTESGAGAKIEPCESV